MKPTMMHIKKCDIFQRVFLYDSCVNSKCFYIVSENERNDDSFSSFVALLLKIKKKTLFNTKKDMRYLWRFLSNGLHVLSHGHDFCIPLSQLPGKLYFLSLRFVFSTH